MIASLNMYARPELASAHTAYWNLIRHHLKTAGIDSPACLQQDADEFTVWRDPALLLSQTCGMPYRVRLHDEVTLVGTPDYQLEGCAPGYYRSAIVVRANDPREALSDFIDTRFAFNSTLSQSGYAAAYWHCLQSNFWFGKTVESGAHRTSARYVTENQADIACLDAVSWRLMQRYDAFARQLRVLAWTAPTPGLPYICAKSRDPLSIRTAVELAIDELPTEHRNTLGLYGLVTIEKTDYMAIGNPPERNPERNP